MIPRIASLVFLAILTGCASRSRDAAGSIGTSVQAPTAGPTTTLQAPQGGGTALNFSPSIAASGSAGLAAAVLAAAWWAIRRDRRVVDLLIDSVEGVADRSAARDLKEHIRRRAQNAGVEEWLFRRVKRRSP